MRPTVRMGARTAAVQPLTSPPTSTMPRGSLSSDRMHRKYLEDYQGWQNWARRFSRTMGVVRFAAGIKADSCARCELRVEERDPITGEWDETDDARLSQLLFDSYRNGLEDTPELIRAHAWHYSIAGELAQVVRDGPHGPDWGIYSMAAIERDKPEKGMTRVKLTPTGHERDETAFVVPSQQVVRMWIPDEEWKAFATSPMAASIEPLHRYHSLARTVKRTADSRLVQNGILWTPEDAHEGIETPEEQETLQGRGTQQPRSRLQRDFYDIARRVYEDDDDILAVAPFLMWWGAAGDEPKSIDIGNNLDEAGIAHRKEALEDFARGIDLPTSIVVGGGPGDKNHWTEWLVDSKYFGQAVAPTMDRMCHADLTQTFLRPVTRFYRLPEDRFRIGYDPGPVIVQPDQSDTALRYYLAGLLGEEATLEAGNFELSQIMQPRELAKLLQVLSKGQAGEATPIMVNTGNGGAPAIDTGAPAGPSTVAPGPPSAPALPRAAAADEPVVPVALGSGAAANRVLQRLTQVRRDAGRELLAAAQLALREAVRKATGKVATRARSRQRTNPEVRAAALAAVEAGLALGAHMAAVGITEAEALDHAFESFTTEAEAALARARARERQTIRAAGLQPDVLLPVDPQRDSDAARYLSAGLMSLAYQRLVSGPRDLPPVGEIAGEVPARLVTNALAVAHGDAVATIGETADAMPEITAAANQTPLEQAITGQLVERPAEARIEYTWEHGFYGDPVRPFEPHEDLGVSGFTTTSPGSGITDDADPLLAVQGTFPEQAFYEPQDHDGCTCTWVPSVRETHGVESGPGERPVIFPT